MLREDVIVNGQMKKPINCTVIEPMSKTYLIVLLGSSADRDSMPTWKRKVTCLQHINQTISGREKLHKIDGTKQRQLVNMTP